MYQSRAVIGWLWSACLKKKTSSTSQYKLVAVMEREQCEAERARLNRQKRKEEFQRLKAFYGYVSKTHPEIVSAFEPKRHAEKCLGGEFPIYIEG